MAKTAPGAHPSLVGLAELLDADRWAAELVDARWRLVWVSEELQTLYGAKDYADLGLGAHLLEARVRGPTISPADRELWLRTNLPPMVEETEGGKQAIAGMLSPGLSRLVEEIEPAATPPWWASSFEFHRGDFSGRINYIAQRVRHEDGRALGYLFLYTPDVPASVQTLMLRGDRPVYERMAALVEPRTRPGAILFGDLEASGTLARQLPSVAYFRLIRALRGTLESEVGRRGGILGKHAGDGVTAFFLSEQLGSEAEAAAAALETALAFPRLTEETANALSAEDLPVKPDGIRLNVGAHWGATVFVGQIAAEGRLEVTALGDEVNEAARVQQSARHGRVLGSKPLLERLTVDRASQMGVDLARLEYEPLESLEGVTEKAIRDAGHLAVVNLHEHLARAAPA